MFSPTIAGWANDHFHTPNGSIWILVGLSVVAGLLGMGLDETAPGKRRMPQVDGAQLEPNAA